MSRASKLPPFASRDRTESDGGLRYAHACEACGCERINQSALRLPRILKRTDRMKIDFPLGPVQDKKELLRTIQGSEFRRFECARLQERMAQWRVVYGDAGLESEGVAELKSAITEYLDNHNANPSPSSGPSLPAKSSKQRADQAPLPEQIALHVELVEPVHVLWGKSGFLLRPALVTRIQSEGREALETLAAFLTSSMPAHIFIALERKARQ